MNFITRMTFNINGRIQDRLFADVITIVWFARNSWHVCTALAKITIE